MSKRKIVVLTICFLLVLSGVRFLWVLHNNTTNLPTAENGVLDLRGVDFTDDVLKLDGEWLFYPWDLIEPDQVRAEQEIITLPGNWRDTLVQFAEDKNPEFLYGTYRLKILLDREDQTEPFALYSQNIRSAAHVFINGESVIQHGTIATSERQYTPDIHPFTLQIDRNSTEIDLIIQVADKAKSRISGIKQPLEFGYLTAMTRSQTASSVAQILSASILLLHFFFAIIIFIGFSRRIELLYLAVVFGASGLSILLDDNRILLVLFPTMSYHFMSVLFYLSYVTSVVFLMLFFKRLLGEQVENNLFLSYATKVFFAIYLVYVIFLLFDVNLFTRNLFAILMLVVPVLIALSLFLIVWNGMSGAIYLLFGMIAIANNIGWASLKTNNVLILPYYPFDIIIAVLCFAVFWFKQFFNVTERSMALADRLQRINDQKDEFLANTSHELRNPLHGIMNISQTVYETEPTMSEENRRNMETLITVSKRMSHTLNDLFDVQRLKEDGIQLNLKDVDLSAVTTSAVDMLRFMTKGKQISFTIKIHEHFPYVLADENRLFQIIFNLIHNAVKFTEQGMITISAEMDGEMAVIDVHDTGIGMDEETLKLIFQPYEQADGSMTSMGSGLGLGLSISDQLVKLHGGTLTAQSVVAKGSTFTFTLPLGKEGAVGIIQNSAIHKPFIKRVGTNAKTSIENELRILVVDDDPLNVSIVEQILQANEFDIVTCTSAAEALKLLEKGKWDLVLSDVMMPRMSGYELTEKIRERYTIAELPILLLTARSQMEDIQTGFHYGANDYIVKPVDKVELVTRVKALTDLRKSLTEQIALEAAWLQAQIQPHFLFNTLNTIAALSDENPEKMMRLIDQFGNYLNKSFTTQNLNNLVPLEQEIELVKSYVYIEGERFEERLRVEWDVQVNVNANVLVPPLAIQTLVENAINHGVLKKPEGGIVRISIVERDGSATISITDDGIGMEPHVAELLLSKARERQSGIGLLNTDKRLRRLFGSGLHVSSTLAEGTTISFSVPL